MLKLEYQRFELAAIEGEGAGFHAAARAGATDAERERTAPARPLAFERGAAHFHEHAGAAGPQTQPPGARLASDLVDGTRNSMRAHDWGYGMTPMPQASRMDYPRGRVLGGSSSINGLGCGRAGGLLRCGLTSGSSRSGAGKKTQKMVPPV